MERDGWAALVLGRNDARCNCECLVTGSPTRYPTHPACRRCPRYACRRSGGDHFHLRQHGAAEGRALHAPHVRYAGGRDSVDVRHRAGRRRSGVLSAVRAVQFGDGRDDRVSGDGFLAAGVGRSDEAARGGERLAGDAGVRVAGRVARRERALREDGRADSIAAAGVFLRCTGAGRRAADDARLRCARTRRCTRRTARPSACRCRRSRRPKCLAKRRREPIEGAGVCVGRKFDSIEWRVIRITDEPIATIDDAEELPAGEIGELIVRGPQASPRVCDAHGSECDKCRRSKIRPSATTSDVPLLASHGRRRLSRRRRAASGTAAASRSASKRQPGRCTPNASRRSSTRIRRCGGRRWSASGRRGDQTPVIDRRAQCRPHEQRDWNAGLTAIAQTASHTHGRSAMLLAHSTVCRSTCATTRRSIASKLAAWADESASTSQRRQPPVSSP